MESKLLSLFSFITVVIVCVCAISLVNVGDDLKPSNSDYTKDIAIAKQNKLDEEKRKHNVEQITITSYSSSKETNPNEGLTKTAKIYDCTKPELPYTYYEDNEIKVYQDKSWLVHVDYLGKTKTYDSPKYFAMYASDFNYYFMGDLGVLIEPNDKYRYCTFGY